MAVFFEGTDTRTGGGDRGGLIRERPEVVRTSIASADMTPGRAFEMITSRMAGVLDGIFVGTTAGGVQSLSRSTSEDRTAGLRGVCEESGGPQGDAHSARYR